MAGLTESNAIKGREYGLYYYIADTPVVEKESYFRALASKGYSDCPD